MQTQPPPGSTHIAPGPPQSTYSLYRVEVVVQWDSAGGAVKDLRLATLQLGPRIAKP